MGGDGSFGTETVGVGGVGTDTGGGGGVGSGTVGTGTGNGGTVTVGTDTGKVAAGLAFRGRVAAAAAGTTIPATRAAAAAGTPLTLAQRSNAARGYGCCRTVKPLKVETCRIVLWRGYATSAFYARAADDPTETSIGEPSSSFRWRSQTAPDTPDARLAHRELVSRLQEDGWVETGQGGEWYATELARSAAQRDEALARMDFPVTTEAGLARMFDVTRPRRHVDRWRVAAAAGLVAAVGVLSWTATHPSVVGAGPLPQHLAFYRNA